MRRKRRRRARHNPIPTYAYWIAGAVGVSAVGGLIYWLTTRDKTPTQIAQPKPQGGTAPTPTPAPSPAPTPAPSPAPVSQLSLALPSVSNVITPQVPACPDGYHAVATGQPNFPWMCIQNGY